MTDDELMQQALEALEKDQYDMVPDKEGHMEFRKEAAITALRERLAQPVHPECKTRRTTREEKIVRPGVYEVPVEQETVMAEYKFQTYAAYKTPDGEMKIGVVPDDAPLTLNGVPLYPRREWVGLTEAEKVNVAIACGCADVAWMEFADAIEAKLKEKNT